MKMKLNIRQRHAILIVAVFIFLPVLLTTVLAQDLGGWQGRLIYLTTMLAVWGILATSMPRRWAMGLAGVGIPFVMVDTVHVIMWQHTPTLMWMYTIAVTETYELVGMLQSYWWLLALVGLMMYVYFRSVRLFHRGPFIQHRVMRWVVLGVSICWIAGAAIGVYRTDGDPANHPIQAAKAITPVSDVFHIIKIHRLKARIHSAQISLLDAQYDVSTTAGDDELVVLVIGESSRYDHWQINGYDRPTSPCLMAHRDSVITFDSCFSVANLTIMSVPMMLYPSTPTERERFITSPSVQTLFRAAGYQTAWIADQSHNDEYLTHIGQRCDYVYYQPLTGLMHYYDTVLWQPTYDCLQQAQTRQMITVHMMGSHFPYNDRYPHDDAVFLPDLRDVPVRFLTERNTYIHAKDELRQVITNSYDNTISYTDMVIDSLCRMFEATHRPVVLMYVADHGESLMDDDEIRVMHGQVSNSVYEYHVPLFVWASSAYRDRYPARWQTLNANRHHLISTMDVYHTLLHLGGIENAQDYESTRSLASPDLRAEQTVMRLDANLNPSILPLPGK